MTESGILSTGVANYPRLLKSSDTNKYFAIEANQSGANAVELVDSDSIREYAQSNKIGFLARFDNSGVYSNGQKIVHLSTMPEIGNPWRIHTVGGTGESPIITGGGLKSTGINGNSLFYLGSEVSAKSGIFSMGFEWEMEPTIYEFDPPSTGVQDTIMNISYFSGVMLPSGGGIDPTNVVHMNFNTLGFKQMSIYPTGNITCLNRSYVGGAHSFHPSGFELVPRKRYSTTFRASGDLLEVSTAGVGNVLYSGSGLGAALGPQMRFWWEGGGTSGTLGRYRYIPKLYRVWAEAEALNDSPAYGMNLGALSDFNTKGPFTTPASYRRYPTGNRVTADSPPSLDYGLIVAGTGTGTIAAGANRILGGNVLAEGGYFSSIGSPSVGGGLYARSVMSVNSTAQGEFLTGAIYSTTGTLATLRNFFYNINVEFGDQEDWKIYGMLSGTGTKRILIDNVTYGNVFFDTDLTPMSGLNNLQGPYEITLFRQANTGARQLVYSKITLPSGSGVYTQRASVDQAYNYTYFRFRTTTPTASGVSIEAINRKIFRNSNY